ncbi:MAG: undecaprenyldiphospho-muramoylpentapeptide beta-N-acetylglucosaminyltransferase [Pseudomonadota bacterium]
MSDRPLAIVTAGGTGGHVYPALAIATVLRNRGYQLRWVGTRRGLENRLAPAANIPLVRLPVRGLRGKGAVQFLLAIVLLPVAFCAALLLMLRYRPKFVIGLGGYASVPTAIAAWLTGRTLALQEQNAVAGSANRLLARFAQYVGTGFPGVFAQHRRSEFVGNPVRAEIRAVASNHPWKKPSRGSLRVLVLGGSLGARPLNQLMPSVARAVGAQCEWMHQSGVTDEPAVLRASTGLPNYQVSAFVDDMASAYAWADLVICRAGALTVAELAVTGRPSVLIPLPHAIDDHQTANARFLADAGAAVLLPQARMPEELESLLRKFLGEVNELERMSAAALACGQPMADERFVDSLEALAA